MKRVLAYQSIDGKTHADEITAIMADFSIEVRGFFQTFSPRSDTMTISHVVGITITNGPLLSKIIQKYNGAMSRYNKRRVKKATSGKNTTAVSIA